MLFSYLNKLYSNYLFDEVIDGYTTSLSTYYGLETLRIFGLDYHKFGNEWSEEQDKIRKNLISYFKIEIDDQNRFSILIMHPNPFEKRFLLIGDRIHLYFLFLYYIP